MYLSIIVIRGLIGSVNALTQMVLLNAVYFKDQWLQQFKRNETKVQPFYLRSSTNRVMTRMMHTYGSFRTADLEQLDARALELPYKVIN